MSKRVSGFAIAAAVLVFFAASPASALNGVLTESQGQRVLHVWGTNYEMGYAQGVLLGDEIIDMMELYSFPADESELSDYEWKREFVMETFDFEQDLLDEEQGIFDGMVDSGVSTFITLLGRDFDVNDLLTMTAMRDLAGLLCTTLIGWDTATLTDAELDGQLIMGHNTDFKYISEDPYRAGKYTVILSYTPSDPNYQRLVSVTFPGFIGVVTGINESGIGLATNRAMFAADLNDMILDPKPNVGVWETRKALMERDYDGDGANTINDVLSHYDEVRHFGSLLIQVFGPKDRSDPPAAVLEINNLSRVVRWPDDDPNLAPDILLALNWEDKLMPERELLHELRYQQSVQKIVGDYNKELTRARIWDYLYINRGQSPISVTFVTSMIIPEQMRLAVSPWKNTSNVPGLNHVWYDFEDLFAGGPDDDTTDDTSADDSGDDAADDTDDVDDTAADDSGDGASDGGESDDDSDDGGCGC